MAGRFNGNFKRMLKKRYRRTSTENLQSLLSSVESGTEEKLIEKELSRRDK